MTSLARLLIKASSVVLAGALVLSVNSSVAIASPKDADVQGATGAAAELREAKIAQLKAQNGSKPQTRIVGGYDSNISNVPWQVAFVWAGNEWNDMPSNFLDQFCGGSIINEDWILTAAHCMEYLEPSDINVLAGVTELTKGDQNRLAVEDIIMHPSYNSETFENDIALVKLWEPLTFNSQIQAIGVASTKPAAGTTAQISGWGSTWHSFGGSFNFNGTQQFPTILQQAGVEVRSDAACSIEVGAEFYDASSMLCARDGGTNPETMTKDTCQGDSGGPLAVQAGGQWELAGITSWGFGCAWTTPGVYTNVANYTSWITQNAIKKVPKIRYDVDQFRSGYRVTLYNVHPDNNYVVSKVAGPGTIRVGNLSGTKLPITVSGLKTGQSASIKITVSRASYVGTSKTIRSNALKRAKIPRFSKVKKSKKGVSFKVTNYNPAYDFEVVKLSGQGVVKVGRAKGAKLPISVTKMKKNKKVKIRVFTSRSGFLTGSKTITVKK